MTQVSNKGCTLFEEFREGVKPIKGRLLEGSISLRGGSIVYSVREEAQSGQYHTIVKIRGS